MTEVCVGEIERRHCYDVLPEVAADTPDDDRAETLNRIAYEFEDEHSDGRKRYEMPEDWWSELVHALQTYERRDDADASRIGWTRAKIARRAGLGALDKGYTTALPIGAQMSNEDPGPRIP